MPIKNVLYLATVTETISKKVETYTGQASTTFKERFNNHKTSFKHKNPKGNNNCELAKHIWVLKDSNIEYNPISWKILGQASTFSPASGRCNLCELEKFYILQKPQFSTLNSRVDLTTHCHHQKRLLMGNK